jgi:hypothetical protein
MIAGVLGGVYGDDLAAAVELVALILGHARIQGIVALEARTMCLKATLRRQRGA